MKVFHNFEVFSFSERIPSLTQESNFSSKRMLQQLPFLNYRKCYSQKSSLLPIPSVPWELSILMTIFWICVKKNKMIGHSHSFDLLPPCDLQKTEFLSPVWVCVSSEYQWHWFIDVYLIIIEITALCIKRNIGWIYLQICSSFHGW